MRATTRRFHHPIACKVDQQTSVTCRPFATRSTASGQSKLARHIGWRQSTVSRKLNGPVPITESDALAIQEAVEMAEER
jgi:DNA-binding transcriptional regulator YdaS (Cro superfamily)